MATPWAAHASISKPLMPSPTARVPMPAPPASRADVQVSPPSHARGSQIGQRLIPITAAPKHQGYRCRPRISQCWPTSPGPIHGQSCGRRGCQLVVTDQLDYSEMHVRIVDSVGSHHPNAWILGHEDRAGQPVAQYRDWSRRLNATCQMTRPVPASMSNAPLEQIAKPAPMSSSRRNGRVAGESLPVHKTRCAPDPTTPRTAARVAGLIVSCARGSVSSATCKVPSMSRATISGRPAAKITHHPSVTTQ